jgi:hypothetical protein
MIDFYFIGIGIPKNENETLCTDKDIESILQQTQNSDEDTENISSLSDGYRKNYFLHYLFLLLNKI